MKRRSKIVCTLGPAVNSEEKIQELIAAGMNVARINCSHGDWETRAKWVEWIRKHSPDLAPVGILADLQGPKFRIGALTGDKLAVDDGQTLTIGIGGELPISQTEILDVMATGDRILMGDGDVELKLGKEIQDRLFEAKVMTRGVIKSKQGVTLVNKVFRSDCITPKDREDVTEAVRLGVDFIALSYVHNGADMLQLRGLVDRSIQLCAKIETRDAVQNIDDILEVSDVVMVARGDLGLQMEIEDVPIAQKKIIAAARAHGKPVITATQMLESMLTNARPTRAEASDIANAILDGTDAVMLSGETASGAFPIEAVKAMGRIAEKAESFFDYGAWLLTADPEPKEETIAISYAVAQLSKLLKPRAILTMTTSGHTARVVSKFRPKVPVLCATWNRKTYHHLSVVWGVQALHLPLPSTTDEQIENATDAFVRSKCLKMGDNIIVSAGVPAGKPGNTNLIMLEKVGVQG
jgi:pyruvate kinase